MENRDGFVTVYVREEKRKEGFRSSFFSLILLWVAGGGL